MVSKRDICKEEVKSVPPFSKLVSEAGTSSYASAKTIYHNRSNAEADRIMQLFSVKPNIKEISNIENNATLLIKLWGDTRFFH